MTLVAREFWRQPDTTFSALGASEAGLTSAEATRRIDVYGANRTIDHKRQPLIVDIGRRLTNPLLAILLVASGVAGATGDRASFVIIVSIVCLSVGLEMVQERRAAATAESLKRSIALRASVLRDGTIREVPVEELVPGDVIYLVAGDLVPADGIVIAANAAQVNQAALTGEAYPAEKRAEVNDTGSMGDAYNLLLHGSSVIGGTATMLIVATGQNTQLGKIARSLSDEEPPTAFERGVHRLGILIVRLTVFLVLFVLLSRLSLGQPPLESFLFAIALAVGLTPELLPMIITVALARGAQRMAEAKVVVKRLSAIHDLGEMDVLCTDKTGTLTEARITMTGHPGIEGADNERVALLAAINARFETGIKSPLDQALVAHLADRPLTTWSKLDERPFDFERRRVSVLVEHDGSRIEIVKGAPETVLSLCERAEDRNGELVPLDQPLRTRILGMQEQYASEGLRMLGVAWKQAQGRNHIDTDDDAGLVFMGLCLFVDPPKLSATTTVSRLREAGVRIKVISGDAGAVVQHLVIQLGLPVEGVLTGDEIAGLDDAALAARVCSTDLFARIAPDQKLRIVRALQSRGATVGYIGDGINDASAIRAADVGLSVDGATDVAREAADMILLDPDLEVLAKGVAEGRRTYANVMKYIRMGTSSNFGNMLTMALAAVVLPFLPLTAVQVLLNNIIYDFSQIGIPFDHADPRDLKRPRGWDMKQLVRFTLVMGPLSTVFDITAFALLLLVFRVDITTFRAAWFVESMVTQILVVFVIRTARHFWADRPHPALYVTAFLGLGIALSLPFTPLAGILGFEAIPPRVIAALALLVVFYLGTAECAKRIAMEPTG